MTQNHTQRIAGSGFFQSVLCLLLMLAALAPETATPQTTELVSVSTTGDGANSDCAYLAISANGSSVAFATYANNIVAGDTNDQMDIFIRALPAGPTTRVSAAQANGFSQHTSISATGRFVAFTSTATNLVAGDTNGKWDIFVRDRDTETTIRVSVGAGGVQADGSSQFPSISGDGNRVAFQSAATNLTTDATGGNGQIFLWDRTSATRTLVSKRSLNAGNNHSSRASISGNGQYVAF
jgi:Tol biopolymer transport system component